MTTSLDRAAIDRVIQSHLAVLRKPGVLTVRPGIKISKGDVTGRPSIVATVERKTGRVPKSQTLPKSVAGVPVDVRQATGLQRLRADDPKKYAIAVNHLRPEQREPEWPFERRVSDGKLVSQATPAPTAFAATSAKPQVAYTAPDVPLSAVTRPMTILACASPDAGFTVLNEFLQATKRNLTVAMYDFTSADILNSLRNTLKRGDIAFQMVLDQPSVVNPTANETDTQTVQKIKAAMRKAAVDWALTRPDFDTSSWIYPSAYHIKVAVRDGDSFWLSSGNWNVSNQPNFAANNAPEGAFTNCDRDWHVVITDAGLAKTFSAYIEHDKAVAAKYQKKGSPASVQKAKEAITAHKQRIGTSAPTAASHGYTLGAVGSSRVDLQACKLEYSIVSPK